MNPIIERSTGQRVIIHGAVNWRIVGTVIRLEDDVVELVDDEDASIFVNVGSIVAIEPYRVRSGSGHYI